MLQSLQKYYTEINANVHRGIHTLSQVATEEMEFSRQKIQNSSMQKMISRLFLREELPKVLTYWRMPLLTK